MVNKSSPTTTPTQDQFLKTAPYHQALISLFDQGFSGLQAYNVIRASFPGKGVEFWSSMYQVGKYLYTENESGYMSLKMNIMKWFQVAYQYFMKRGKRAVTQFRAGVRLKYRDIATGEIRFKEFYQHFNAPLSIGQLIHNSWQTLLKILIKSPEYNENGDLISPIFHSIEIMNLNRFF